MRKYRPFRVLAFDFQSIVANNNMYSEVICVVEWIDIGVDRNQFFGGGGGYEFFFFTHQIIWVHIMYIRVYTYTAKRGRLLNKYKIFVKSGSLSSRETGFLIYIRILK